MSRSGAVFGVVALLGLGAYAAIPGDEPDYIGDMPSIIEQAEAAPPMPEPFVPPPSVPAPPPVDGPNPVVPEAPPPIPSVAGERVPAPITDAPQDIRAGSGGNGDSPSPGLPDLLGGLPIDGLIPCVDTDTIFRPGQGTLDCLTGELITIDPALCEVVPPLPLPVGCPPPVTVPPVTLPE